MTNQNAHTDAVVTTGTKWVTRFGVLESLVRREGRNGPFATFTIDCRKFKQSGIAFGDVAQDMFAAGIGAKVRVRGPLELRTIEKDGEFSSSMSFKAVYFQNQDSATPETDAVATEEVTEALDETAEMIAAADPVDEDDLTELKGIGAKTAERLAEEGITSYAQIARLSDKEFAELDARVSAVRGTLIRNQVREAAAVQLAERENAFA